MEIGLFVAGFICGLIVASIFVAVLIYFKKAIIHKTGIVEKRIESVSPKSKGFIYEPLDEATEAREEIIEENRRHGRDTKLSDLI